MTPLSMDVAAAVRETQFVAERKRVQDLASPHHVLRHSMEARTYMTAHVGTLAGKLTIAASDRAVGGFCQQAFADGDLTRPGNP